MSPGSESARLPESPGALQGKRRPSPLPLGPGGRHDRPCLRYIDSMTPTLIVHGGAGSMKSMSDPREGRYRAGLRDATAAGAAILQAGGSAVDAVVAVNVHMEDGGVFNAGLGSCLTADGGIEMDAAVMDGRDRGFGAVAGVRGVANPVELARRVMLDTPHCMFAADGAEALARGWGMTFREDFPSEVRKAEWRKRAAQVRESGGSLADRLATLGGVLGDASDDEDADAPVGRRDTVGAVAMDADGHLAVGVTTGGIWLKLPGRIGDVPVPGAGLWALDGQGAACATGTGEAILKVLMCREVVDRMIGGAGVTAACEATVALLEREIGSGLAGVIAIAPDGTPGFAFHTRGMGRSVWRAGMSEPAAAVWPEEGWDRAVPG